MEAESSSCRTFRPNGNESTLETTMPTMEGSGRLSGGSRASLSPKGWSGRSASTAKTCATTSREDAIVAEGSIPAADPRRNYLAHRREIEEAIDRVLASGWY